MICGAWLVVFLCRGWPARSWLKKCFVGGGLGDLGRQFLWQGLFLWPSLTFYVRGDYHGHLIQVFFYEWWSHPQRVCGARGCA